MIRTRCQTHKSKQKVASLSTRCQYRNFGAAIDEALNTGHGFFSCNLSIVNMPAMALKENLNACMYRLFTLKFGWI